MAANSFKADKFVRLTFPGHGITVSSIGIKVVTHADGTEVGITREEWQKMLPPLLSKEPNSNWKFAGEVFVEVTEIPKPRSH